MSKFKRVVFRELEKGQELSRGDKLLVNDVVDDFTQRWENSTREELKPTIPALGMVFPRLKEYGFRMPSVESLLDDYESMAREILVEKKRSGFPERGY